MKHSILSIPYQLLVYCLLTIFLGLAPTLLHAENIGIDKETLKNQLTDLAIEKIFSGLPNVPEDKLKEATYFNELVRDMAPLGIKLDETNFSEAALNIYNTYKAEYEKEKDPIKAKQKVKDLLKGNVKTLIFQSLDKGSQEVLTDLNGLLTDAQKDLKAILDMNEELEKNPKADYAELLKKYGVKGEALDKFEKMEGAINGGLDKFGDYIKASGIIYSGMTGSSGDKIDALFELGTEFGGKVPLIGKFVELYFKVAKGMVDATGRLAKILQERQAGCFGGEGYVGSTETVKAARNERAIMFEKQFGRLVYPVCPADRTKEFYRDIYVETGEGMGNQLYFWNGSEFIKGNADGGGIESIKALRSWLRLNNHADKSSDMEFMVEAYNTPPGFGVRKKQHGDMVKEINSLIKNIDSSLYCMSTEEFNKLLLEQGGLQEVIDSSDGKVIMSKYRFSSLPEETVVNKILEDQYIKKVSQKFGLNCKALLSKLKDIIPVKIKGEVSITKGDNIIQQSGIIIEVTPEDRIIKKCSSLSTNINGLFYILVIKNAGDDFSLNLIAKDKIDASEEVSVAITGDTKTYNVKLKIKSTCQENQELDKNGTCVCMKGLEDLDGKCVPACKEGEQRDNTGQCIKECKPGEELNTDGKCVPACKEGETRDKTGKCVKECKPGEELIDGKCVPICKEGETRDKTGKCVKECKPGEELIDGKCVPACKEGETRNKTGKCVKECKPGEELIDGKCVPICKEGETRDKTGKCVKECKPGEELIDGKCVPICGPNEERTASGRCVCIDGYESVGGKCVPVCKEGEKRDRTGKCVKEECKPGEERDANGKCVAICGANEERTASGRCVCLNGYKKDESGVCIKSDDQKCTDDSACDQGYECKGGKCVFIKSDDKKCPDDYECSQGYECKNGKCVFIKSDDKKCTDDSSCGKGYVCNQATGKCFFKKQEGCKSDAQCSDGYKCDTKSGDCKFIKLPGCQEKGCPDGYECNKKTGECQYKKAPGCQEAGCPDGYECNKKTGECQYKKSSGCQSDGDCASGYVCSGNGKCVSPFDENYTNFGNTLTDKDADRGQDIVDQAASDNKPGKKDGYTSEGIDKDLQEIEVGLVPPPVKPPTTPPVTPPKTPPETPPATPPTTPPPATSTGIDIVEVGTAPAGQCLIVDGQLVPVENWPVKIAGMTLTLTGAVNQTSTSSGSGSFNFKLIPAGDYVIAVTDWNYGMTKQSFTAPSGKAIKITLKGSCPYLYVWTGEGYAKENDIYSVARVFPVELMTDKGRQFASRDGLFLQQVTVENISPQLKKERSYRDYYQISKPPAVDKQGNYRLLVREQASERSFSDLLELWAVDHKPGQQTAITRSGRLLLYDKLNPLEIENMQAAGTPLYNNDTLEIAVPREALASGLLAIDWQGFQDGDGKGRSAGVGRPRISLQRLDPAGIWQTIDWAYPRDEMQKSFLVLDNLGSGWDTGGRIRLTALSCDREKFHRIKNVAWGKYLKETPASSKLTLTSAVKSGNEDVSAQALTADGNSVFLAPEEEVHLRYKSIPLAKGRERTFVFVSEGIYIPMPMIRLTATP